VLDCVFNFELSTQSREEHTYSRTKPLSRNCRLLLPTLSLQLIDTFVTVYICLMASMPNVSHEILVTALLYFDLIRVFGYDFGFVEFTFDGRMSVHFPYMKFESSLVTVMTKISAI